ncbi:cytochrome c biogenesis protein CcdA [Mycobacterium frederiksbergense]|uniref:Cytochrome c biogenesis protein CcdA n=1 Tax=Mycolicibacterium frederiksbergense TaxID=117567 RepID=A0ABT6KUB0_9MYCO|nr:cytochrome c biogenesis CcdA family protein [Mycolicibacterium frederiksbergense]MDH6194239.1 cytochrome c biogenesis protein CcdA [Mycolicibacterium frederiksbergense]
MPGNLVGLAFGAGLVAALNPCGFALLPGYLALVVRGPSTRAPVRALGRALVATAAMTAGFVTVFGTFALLTVAAANTVQRYLPYVTVLIGVSLILLGGWLLTGRQLGLLLPDSVAHDPRWAPTARLGSMAGYGIGYALASLSCTVGPFLAVTGASLESNTAWRRVAVFGAYAAGFTLVVGVLAVAAALASTVVVERLRRIVPYVNRFSGVLLIIVGGYVAYYGLYEIQLFSAGGNPDDPVIVAAGRLQGTLAGWVHRHGAWPWLSALLVLAVVSLLGRVAVRRLSAQRSKSDSSSSGTTMA